MNGRLTSTHGLWRCLAFAEDALYAGIAKLHVSGGLAIHQQHFVVAERVIRGAILREVSILERTNADRLRNLLPLFIR